MLVTDPRACRRPLVTAVVAAVRGGVTAVMVRAPELSVREIDPVLLSGPNHGPEEVLADLVSEATGSRVDRDRNLPFLETQHPGCVRVVDLIDALQL